MVLNGIPFFYFIIIGVDIQIWKRQRYITSIILDIFLNNKWYKTPSENPFWKPN